MRWSTPLPCPRKAQVPSRKLDSAHSVGLFLNSLPTGDIFSEARQPSVRQLPRLRLRLTKVCLGRVASSTEAGTFREGPTPISSLCSPPVHAGEDLMTPSHHDPTFTRNSLCDRHYSRNYTNPQDIGLDTGLRMGTTTPYSQWLGSKSS